MKCIILSRVSTLNQSLEQQTKELFSIAIKDGYKPQNIIVIENKESAIKNDEEHRLGLVEMKEAIANDPTIDCVYVREVSRIGRRYDVLSNIKTFFVTNKIQLVVCGETRIELLDKNGKVTMLGGIMFEIACQTATQEMADKKIRFAQGKAKAIAEGKKPSGRVLYGYTTDTNNYIIIKEDEAEIVRWIFNEYVNTKKSTLAIYRELVEKGTWERVSTDSVGANKIRIIIHKTAYSGQTQDSGWHYDAIVSEELQNKAIEKCNNAKATSKFTHKHVYYAQGLVKCTCGHTMSPRLNTQGYFCPHCLRYVPMNTMDYLVWNEAQVLKSRKMKEDTQFERQNANNSISENNKKLDAANKRIEELDELEVEIASTALLIRNREKREAFIATKSDAVADERKKLQTNIINLKQANKQLERLLAEIEVDKKNASDLYVASITDDAKRKEIIESAIESVQVIEIDDKHIKFIINPTKSSYPSYAEYPFSYIYDKTKRPYCHLYRCNGDTMEDVTKQIEKRISTKGKGRKIVVKGNVVIKDLNKKVA